MSKCSNCPHSWGGCYDSSSDWCDACRHDPDTGWGGFTDHSIGKHFNSEKERNTYYGVYEDNEPSEYEGFSLGD